MDNWLNSRNGQEFLASLRLIAEGMRVSKHRKLERISTQIMAAIISTGNVERNYQEPQEKVNERVAKTAVDAAETLIAELESRKK